MSLDGYWNKIMEQRASRRAVVVGGASLAGAAALLAACGGSSSNSSGGAAVSSLLYTPSDSTSKAVKGGIANLSLPNDVDTFDGVGGNSGTGFTNAAHTYSRLLRYVPGKAPTGPDGSVEPDAAASYEVSGDGLQWTFHMRPNMKFDPRPPTNGRVMTSADVKFTWDRFASLNQGRTDLTGRPEAPVVSVSTPDPSTFVFKLGFPYADLPNMLPYYRYMGIQPVELEQFNYKSDMRGTGPWRMTEYTPSSKVSYRKNPDWYDADKVFLDGIDYYIIPEYAANLAQFRAGNLWYYAVNQEDILQTKNDLSSLQMQTTGYFTRSNAPYIMFSVAPDSPFLDDRVRRAASMLIDRDAYIDTFFNVTKFKSAGADPQEAWNTHIPAGITKYYMDPHGTDLGDGAANFKFDPANAKKLLQAAGHTTPITTDYNFTNNGYTPLYVNQGAVYAGMLQQFGDFKLSMVQHDYATDWVPNFHSGGGGQYKGFAHGTATTQATIDGYLYAAYRSGGQKTVWRNVDAQMDAMIDAQRREADDTKRTGIIKDFAKYISTKMYNIPAAGEAYTFTLNQPYFANYGVYRQFDGGNAASEAYTKMWFDASKKTS